MKPSHPEAIFLIHHGHQDYLRIAASEAKASGNSVILVGNDVVTAQLCDAYYDDTNVLLPEYEAFEREYVHLSSASREFELLCFKRYFYLQAIAQERNLSHFWMIDSDAIILRNLWGVAHHFLLPNGYQAALSTPHQSDTNQIGFWWASSAHTSFWTMIGLNHFIEFLKNLYRGETRNKLDQKYQWHLEHKIPGGICDMTALFLWQQKQKNIYNLVNAHKEQLPFFDNNLNETGNSSPNEFLMVRNVNLKKVLFKENMYWIYQQYNLGAIPVAALHFQGRAKSCMATFQKKRSIHYWGFAPYSFLQYIQKRANSLNRKLKKTFSDTKP
jgi:hypothetical protein